MKTKDDVWMKACYIDGIIKNRFNKSIKRDLACMISAFRICNRDYDSIYGFLEDEVEFHAKTVDYLNSIRGYIFGYTQSATASGHK